MKLNYDGIAEGDIVNDTYFGVGDVVAIGIDLKLVDDNNIEYNHTTGILVEFKNLPLFVENTLLRVAYTAEGHLVQYTKVYPQQTLFKVEYENLLKFLNYPSNEFMFIGYDLPKLGTMDKLKHIKYREDMETNILNHPKYTRDTTTVDN